jgi:endonuclease/exonuclease/phosphatase family metal-dependent hydrolase
MRKIILPILISIFVLSNIQSFGQKRTYSIMFYNVENLFDTLDDPNKKDENFLPRNPKYNWNAYKYQRKLDRLAKVVSSIYEYLPDIIGFAEVENFDVLEDLCNHKLLKSANYKIVHHESSDMRGIDCAMVYKEDRFKVLYEQNVIVKYDPSKRYRTREFLYVKGVTHSHDTLHLFVNHWKSRMGGVEKTEHKRIKYATLVKHLTDSIMQVNYNANIVLMGDFNDNPDNKSISGVLGAVEYQGDASCKKLYNLFLSKFNEGEGTLYYKSWELYDQFIISGSFFNNKRGLIKPKASIFKPEWVLYDAKGTLVPYSTFYKGSYKGGYSDHLAIKLVFRVK